MKTKRARRGAISIFTLATAFLGAACGDAAPPSERAAMFVARDMLDQVPAEAAYVSRRRIMGRWQSAGRRAVPVSVIQASDLAAIDTSWRAAGDSATLVLNLFEPRMLGADSVAVTAEWLLFEPGESFWGHDYRYTLRCATSCILLDRTGPDFLN